MFDYLTMILSFYNAIVIPLEVAFLYKDQQIFPTVDILIDLVFFVDLLLMFRTTQQDNRGYEITDNYEIFKIYTSTWRFWFDFLAMTGNSLFTYLIPELRYFKLFKASRVFRIGDQIMKSHLTRNIKVILKIVKLTLY